VKLYGEYIKEREGYELLVNKDGSAFCSYKVFGDSIYLRDMFVSFSERGKGLAKSLAKQVENHGKMQSCKTMVTSVDLNTSGASENVAMFVNYGFKIKQAQGNALWLEKEL